MKLNHINIRGSKELIEKVKDFYSGILGLVEGYRPQARREGYWLYADTAALVHLTIDEHYEANSNNGFLDHIAFESTDLQKLVSKLNASNIKYTSVYLSDINLTQIFFKDPANIGLEIGFRNEKI